MSLLLLSGGLPRIRLLDPGRKDPRLSFARAQLAGVESTYLGPDAATWQTAAADVLRFQGAGRRALFEGQRTNLLASARTTGGVGYANTNIASVEAAVGPDGLAGTASLITETTDGSALSHQILCSDTASIVSGTTYTMTCIVKPGACSTVQIVGRTGAFGTAVWANYDLSGAGSVGTYGASVSRATITRTGSWYVISCSGPASATGTLAPWALVMSTSATDSRSPAYVGTGRAFTAGWSWVEQAAFASAPTLPPVASPAASTRGRAPANRIRIRPGSAPAATRKSNSTCRPCT